MTIFIILKDNQGTKLNNCFGLIWFQRETEKQGKQV